MFRWVTGAKLLHNISWRQHCTIAASALMLSQLYHVSGKSMSPTINWQGNDSILFLNKILCWLRAYKPQVNDVVVYIKPGDVTKSVVKRIKATSGETIVTRDGKEIVIQAGHFWAEGDNARCSVDSNDYGEIPTKSIIGKCLWILPLHLSVLSSLKEIYQKVGVSLSRHSRTSEL